MRGSPAPNGVSAASPVTSSVARASALSPEVAARVHDSEQVGLLLYLLDKASAIGTDVMFANIKKPSDAGIGGWLTFGSADAAGKPTNGYRVLFLTKEEPPRIACRVQIDPGAPPIFVRHEPPLPAAPEVVLMFHARQAAIAAMPSNGQPINPVVLPGGALGYNGILVYLLAGTKRPGELVFGIHYRALVSKDGSHVIAMMPLSRSALIVRDRDVPAGVTVEGNYVNHVVTDWPLETHVFVSLLHHRRPIFVGTRLGQWKVVGDKIEFLGRGQ
jgi:hypothetical protein